MNNLEFTGQMVESYPYFDMSNSENGNDITNNSNNNLMRDININQYSQKNRHSNYFSYLNQSPRGNKMNKTIFIKFS